MRRLHALVLFVVMAVALVDFFVALRERGYARHLERELALMRQVDLQKTALIEQLQARVDDASGEEFEPPAPTAAVPAPSSPAPPPPPSSSSPPPPPPAQLSSVPWTGSDDAAAWTGAMRAALPAEARFLTEDEFFVQRHPYAARRLAEYVLLHRRIMRGDVPSEQRRFIHLQPAAQSCNRLLATVSALLLGVLTDRALVVSYAAGFYASFADQFEGVGIDLEAAVPVAGSSRSLDIANPGPNGALVELLLCSDLRELRETTLSISSNQYFARYLVYNPHHAEEIVRMFGDLHGPPIFHVLARFLLRPNAELARIVDEFWAKHLAGRRTFGVQMRSMGFNGVRMFRNEYDTYRRCAEQYSAPDAVWFVATDIDDSQRDITAQWGADHELRMIPFQRANNPAGVRQAMADIFLLARCDDMLITSFSTYGFVAASLKATLRPVAIVTDVREPPTPGATIYSYGRFDDGFHQETPRQQGAPTYMHIPQASEKREHCRRETHNEPCFHFFGLYEPSSASCFDQRIIQREMLSGQYC